MMSFWATDPLENLDVDSSPHERSCTGKSCDLVLSSGFLAFAYHAGFLQAVDQVACRCCDLKPSQILGPGGLCAVSRPA